MQSKKREERLVLPPLPRDPTRPRNKKELDISRVPVLPFLNRQPQDDRQLNSRAFDLQYKRRRPPSLHRRSEPLFPPQDKASESTESFEWELEMALNAGRGRYRTFSEPVPLPQHDQNNRPMTRHVSERFKLPPMQLQHVRGLDNQYQTGRMYHARPGGNPAIYLSELQSKYGIRSNEKESRPTSRVSSYAHIPPIVINEVETRPQSKHLPLRPSTPDSGLQSDFHSEIDALPNIVPAETTDQEAEKSPPPTLAPADEGIDEEIAASSVSTLIVDHEPPPEVHTPVEEKLDNPEEPPAPTEVEEPVVEPHVVEEETTKVSLPEPCDSPPPPPSPSPPPTLSFETKESDPEPVILTQKTEPVPVQPVVEKENTPPPSPPIEKDVPKIDFETTVEPVESEKEEEMEFVIVAAESSSSSAASLPAISDKEETVDVPKKKAKPKEKQERKKIEKKKKRQPVRERPKREKTQEKETEEEEEEIITVDEEPAPPSPAIEELEDSRPNSAEERERLRKEKEAEREKRRMAKKAKRERQKREREAKKEAEEIKDTSSSAPKPIEDTIIRESESLHECPHHESDTYDYEKELEDEAERLRLEEEERQRELDARRKAREEEERRAREEEEERRRLELRREQLEAQRRLEEERRRAEEEMRARIRRQLDEERARKMNRLVAMSQLQIEMGNLEEEHRVTRAFVWSYFRVEEPEHEAYEN